RIRAALEPSAHTRLRLLCSETAASTLDMLRQPLSVARLVAVDLETTGLSVQRDRVISIGAVAVRARTIRHDDCFERYLRQERATRAGLHTVGDLLDIEKAQHWLGRVRGQAGCADRQGARTGRVRGQAGVPAGYILFTGVAIVRTVTLSIS